MHTLAGLVIVCSSEYDRQTSSAGWNTTRVRRAPGESPRPQAGYSMEPERDKPAQSSDVPPTDGLVLGRGRGALGIIDRRRPLVEVLDRTFSTRGGWQLSVPELAPGSEVCRGRGLQSLPCVDRRDLPPSPDGSFARPDHGDADGWTKRRAGDRTLFEAHGLEYSIDTRDGRVFHRETRRDSAGRLDRSQ